MKKIYYDEEFGKWVNTSLKKKKEEVQLVAETPEKQVVELKHLLEVANDARTRLGLEIEKLCQTQRQQTKRMREYEKYESLYLEQQALFVQTKTKLDQTELTLSEVQGRVDGAMERAMIAETDVAEIQHTNVLKNGMLRSLRGFFASRHKGFTITRPNFQIGQSDINHLLEIIDKGINTNKITCQKTFKNT